MKKMTISQIASMVINQLNTRVEGVPTEVDLLNMIEYNSKLEAMMSGEEFTEEEKRAIQNTVQERQAIKMDVGVSITDESTYRPWLAQRKADIDECYWERYKALLMEKGWSGKVVSTLDKVGDEILELMGDPEDLGSWHRKGLVLGDVQSGKTSSYLALINKAADAGYKLIILLSGTLEALRKQTQERVDEGFVGRNSRNALERDLDKKYIGVGKIDNRFTAWPLTDVISDFDIKHLQALNFDARNIDQPMILVVKKNTTVLKNLLAWIDTSYKDQENDQITTPLLIIDDEADNASVNTKKPEVDPTAVNAGIRKILHIFQRSTYVAVTATPFANIFINPEKNDGELDDLFPSDFIYSLSPPSNYIGSHSIFAEDAEYESSLQVISDGDDFASKAKSAHVVTYLPESLQKAVRYFLLCNYARDVKGSGTDHRSMLINVNPYTQPQESVYDLIQSYVDRIQRDVKTYGKLSLQEAEQTKSIAMLHDTWKEFGMTKLVGVEFADVLPNLNASIMPIKVTMVNTKTKSRGLERLDYEPYNETGLRVIAIGGNSLSRGITLEGLCVSYFYRESKMYDTLLQMGRWFGYRPGYESLFKIWMGEEMIGRFEHIHNACQELRSEISYMNKLGQTPSEFGLKVLEHPETLMITANNKMRDSKTIEQWVSYSGKLIETPWLNTKTLESNFKVTKDFVEAIAEKRNNSSSKIVYEHVDGVAVAEYIDQFVGHPGHFTFDGRQIAKFIDENMNNLSSWTVVIATGSVEPSADIAGMSIKKAARKMFLEGDCIRLNRSRVGTPGATAILLTDAEKEQVKSDYIEILKSRGKYGEKKAIVAPDYLNLRYSKKPILVIYPMSCKEITSEQDDNQFKLARATLGDKVIVGLSIGFPSFGEKEKKLRYKMNLVERKAMLPFYFEGDDDDEV